MPRFLLILELLLTVLLARRASSRHLQVFIIAHSHCDPGWLDTFDVYYQKQVHQILSSVTRSLQADSRRKFVWAEISFFSRWFESLDGQAKMEFRKLLQRGQWEFVGGGWVQNDEANPSIYSTINQNFVGHNYLLQKFGIQPRIAWQIDPFGHSAITPSLFRRMGYEALVINRIHFARKEHLKIKQDMEFMWNGAPIGCSDCSIFTHVLHTHYSAPKTFDWEENYPKAPIIQEKNIESRANELVKVLRVKILTFLSSKLFKTNPIPTHLCLEKSQCLSNSSPACSIWG